MMNTKQIANLHYITQDIEQYPHEFLAEQACLGGADWIQLRVKNKSQQEWLEIAKKTKLVCEKYQARLIVNDNVWVAKEVAAHGVHLGLKDLNPREARKILGPEFIIGGSSNTLEDIKKLYACEVDYIGLGPFKFTQTKEKLSPVLGLNGISNVISSIANIHLNAHTNIPVIVIGGINSEDVKPLMQLGIHGVAVSSAISMSENIALKTKEFLNLTKN